MFSLEVKLSLQNTFSDSRTLKFSKKGSLAPQIWWSVIYMDAMWVSVGGDLLVVTEAHVNSAWWKEQQAGRTRGQ